MVDAKEDGQPMPFLPYFSIITNKIGQSSISREGEGTFENLSTGEQKGRGLKKAEALTLCAEKLLFYYSTRHHQRRPA